MSKENIIELFKYNNHRLVEMRICAEEQEFIEDWGVLKGIPLHTFFNYQ